MMRAPSLILAAAALTAPLPAAAAGQANWDVLVERAFGMDRMGFLVDSGSNYIDQLQSPEQVAQSDAAGIPVPTSRVEEITAHYMSAVAPAIKVQYENAFSAGLSDSNTKLLLDETVDEAGQASFACLLHSAPAPDGGLAFDTCGADATPAYRTAAKNFVDAFNAAITSRTLNDAFGGATCRALDDVVAAYTTETYTLEINGSIGLGAGNSRDCSLLKVRWAGLAGYDWLIASEEFGE